MQVPSWTKPSLYGAVVGGILVAIVGFSWGGWVTGGAARQSAETAAATSRTDLAAAVCVRNFLAESDARDKLAELQAVTGATQQRTYVETGGWAVMPDSDVATRQVSTLCARMLMALAPIELPVVANGEVVEPGQVMDAPATPPAPPAASTAPVR